MKKKHIETVVANLLSNAQPIAGGRMSLIVRCNKLKIVDIGFITESDHIILPLKKPDLAKGLKTDVWDLVHGRIAQLIDEGVVL